jgi:hypothetical protein
MHDVSTTFIRSDQPGRARTSPTDAPDGLEWQAFATRYFPGRRRHDLDALTAYETYRRRFPLPRRGGEGQRPAEPAHSDDAVLVAAAAAAWETEGGSVQ